MKFNVRKIDTFAQNQATIFLANLS